MGQNSSPVGQNSSLVGQNISPVGRNSSPVGRTSSPVGRTGSLGRSWAAFRWLLGAFRWSWALPERSGDVPRSSRARIIDFSMVFGGLGGGGPRTCQSRGWIVRPPKSRFFKTDQTPLELGKGKGNGLG